MGNDTSGAARPMSIGTRFSRDAFVGTARYYTEYRLPYPDALLQRLRLQAGVSGRGRLVDLGCGPGRIALALSPYFTRVTAVDIEEEMLGEGRRKARREGISNIRWYVSAAESFRVAPRSVELVTIGEAFHRFDQRAVARRARQWLQPSCCIAVLWQNHPWQGGDSWHEAVRETMHRWTPIQHSSSLPVPRTLPFEEVLSESGYVGVERREFVVPHVWTVDELVGFFYSTSILSKRVLSDSAAGFAADLRARLLELDERGEYPENVTFGYIIGRSQ